MYAVIETGGKQYRVSEGDVINIEKIKGDPNTSVDFDKVLLIGGAEDTTVGTPYLEAAKVFGTIIESGKGKKVIIFKYKAKKDYRKKQGHRQPYTAVQIDKISVDGKAPEKKAVLAKTEESDAKAVALESETAEKSVAEKKTASKAAAKKPAAKKEASDKTEAVKKTTTKKTAAKKADESNSVQE